MTSGRLVDLSVREFVAAVASTEHPVPAGGSVAALTAASSAALLALACGVTQRHHPDALNDESRAAERLQRQMLDLVDEDAAAFRSFLDAKRSGADVGPAAKAASGAPLAIARGCIEIIDLTQAVEVQITGPMLGDVHAARLLAAAALRTALEISELNSSLLHDESERQALRDEISRLRSRQVR
jgi:formiminotetrahydrofolate cyclodeaminase